MTSHHVHLPVSDVLVGQVAVAILEKGQALASMHLVVGSDQWQELEQAMFTAGLVRRIPGENGERSELTPAGRALLKYYLPATGHKDESIIDKTRASKSKFGYAFGEFKVKNVPIEEVRQRLMMALDGLSAQVELLDEGALSFNSPWVFHNGFHRLSLISFGRLEFDRTLAGEVSVKYQISMRRLWVSVLLSLISFIVLNIPHPIPFVGNNDLLNLGLALLLGSVAELIAYWFNRLIANLRFYLLVEKACLEAFRSSGRVAGATKRAE